MQLAFHLETAALIWLNPLILAPYFFAAAHLAEAHNWTILAQKLEDNCTRLSVIPYLLIAPLLYCAAVGFMYLVLSSINPQLDWRMFLAPSTGWIFYACTAVAALSGGMLFSKSGLEGNIGGFFVAPLWLAAIVATVVQHLSWLNHVVFR